MAMSLLILIACTDGLLFLVFTYVERKRSAQVVDLHHNEVSLATRGYKIPGELKEMEAHV